jgi:hypothetical protein
MKLIKKLSPICALLCITQVCLLSLASVSPQIHARVFHGGHYAEITCLDESSVCTELQNVSQDEEESQPDLPEDDSDFCPVIIFKQGAICVDELAVRFPERNSVVKSVFIVTDTLWKSSLEECTQARAPPLS